MNISWNMIYELAMACLVFLMVYDLYFRPEPTGKRPKPKPQRAEPSAAKRPPRKETRPAEPETWAEEPSEDSPPTDGGAWDEDLGGEWK